MTNNLLDDLQRKGYAALLAGEKWDRADPDVDVDNEDFDETHWSEWNDGSRRSAPQSAKRPIQRQDTFKSTFRRKEGSGLRW